MFQIIPVDSTFNIRCRTKFIRQHFRNSRYLVFRGYDKGYHTSAVTKQNIEKLDIDIYFIQISYKEYLLLEKMIPEIF